MRPINLQFCMRACHPACIVPPSIVSLSHVFRHVCAIYKTFIARRTWSYCSESSCVSSFPYYLKIDNSIGDIWLIHYQWGIYPFPRSCHRWLFCSCHECWLDQSLLTVDILVCWWDWDLVRWLSTLLCLFGRLLLHVHGGHPLRGWELAALNIMFDIGRYRPV